MNAKQKELFEEILTDACLRGYVTQFERHILTVEISAEAAREVADEVHKARVIRNGGKIFGTSK